MHNFARETKPDYPYVIVLIKRLHKYLNYFLIQIWVMKPTNRLFMYIQVEQKVSDQTNHATQAIMLGMVSGIPY